MVTGVLPVPPTEMLPTTMTGTFARHGFASPVRYARRRRKTAKRKRSARGKKTSAPPPRRCHSRSNHAATLRPRLRGERDVVEAGEPRAFHHVHDRLVRGGGVGADGDDRVLAALRGFLQALRESGGIAEHGRGPVDGVAALR